MLKRPESLPGYLGWVVIWPTDPPVIGRTVLGHEPNPGGALLDMTVTSHLAGHQLQIPSVTFATKDFGVAACATIATWLATEVMHEQFGTPSSSTSEVTLTATRHSHTSGRSLPQHYGLSLGEMSHALAEIGYSPFIYDLPSFPWRAIGTTFGYVASGVPVILQCEMQDGSYHALLAIGHESDVSRIDAEATFADAVDAFIVHDDRHGPYCRLSDFRIPDKGKPGCWVARLSHPTGLIEEQWVKVIALLVPLPAGVNIISQRAHIFGEELIGSLLENVQGDLGLSPGDVVIRTRLWEATRLKAESLNWSQQGAAAALRLAALPRWVWLSEAFTLPVNPNQAVARSVIDATRLPGSTGRTIQLWGHADHYLLDL